MNIAVYCAANQRSCSTFGERTEELGKWIAKKNHTLVYGIKDYGAYCNGRRLSKPEVHSIGDSSINVNGFMLLEANEKEAAMIRKAMVTRTYGASSIEHIQVVLGKSVAYVSTLLAPWDIAAGMVIAKELDLHYSTVDGKEVDFLVPNKKTTGVICSKDIAEEIIAAFK